MIATWRGDVEPPDLAALSECLVDAKLTMDDLWRHATRGRVANVMRPYIKAITA